VALEEVGDGSQVVFGLRRAADPDAPTVLLHANGDGTVVMHLAALRALGDERPVNLKLIVEGPKEQRTGSLEEFVTQHAELLRADSILVCDSDDAVTGGPAATVTLRGRVDLVVAVEALAGELRSGMFGGPAPDALAALIHILTTLRDDVGNTTVDGLEMTQVWPGSSYRTGRFRAAGGVPDGVRLLGGGSVADMLWARPALTVLGIDCPPVAGSAAAIQPRARARLDLRVPSGTDAVKARDLLVEHLYAAAPWGVRVSVEEEALGQPFQARTEGPAYRAFASAVSETYGREMALLGQGGTIPLCDVLAKTYPQAEIILMGREEPRALGCATSAKVDPREIVSFGLAEVLFLRNYGGWRTSGSPG
jgi:acetylornithine deacetylase/succinyl-diaminopimelate desuccinylase-like protein